MAPPTADPGISPCQLSLHHATCNLAISLCNACHQWLALPGDNPPHTTSSIDVSWCHLPLWHLSQHCLPSPFPLVRSLTFPPTLFPPAMSPITVSTCDISYSFPTHNCPPWHLMLPFTTKKLHPPVSQVAPHNDLHCGFSLQSPAVSLDTTAPLWCLALPLPLWNLPHLAK